MACSQFLDVRYAPIGNTFLPDQHFNSIPSKGAAQRTLRSYSHGSVRSSFAGKSLASAAGLPDPNLSSSPTLEGSSGSYPYSPSSDNSFNSHPDVDETPEELEASKTKEGHAESEDDGELGVTLMIRNLPRHALQDVLLVELERSGYAGSFDLLYVPVEFEKGRRPTSKGFGFVHVKSRAISEDLIERWHGTIRFGGGRVAKPLSLSRAHVQGVSQNLEQWGATKTRRIRNSEYRPLVLGA